MQHEEWDVAINAIRHNESETTPNDIVHQYSIELCILSAFYLKSSENFRHLRVY